MNYNIQLQTKEWKSKRLKILQRDNFCCQNCGSKNKLQVHHKKYIKEKFAWEVPNSFLITLCEICHKDVHEKRHISTFTSKKKQKSKKKHSRIEKMYLSMTKKDFELQKLYDKLNKKTK